MRQWIVVLSALLFIGLASGAAKSSDKDPEKTLEKVSERVYPKKVTSLKKRPTKSPNTKSPVEAFKDLPTDDLEFIKELDKQFKLHGDKIKIKVERDNSTLKNSKRTVDGDLGYGYYNGQQGNGYDYPKPSFTFYPYSQQDIPASAPGYHIKDEEESTVSIIPSYSYEIKQTQSGGYESNAPFIPSQPDHEQNSYQQQQDTQGHGGYQHNEPVIVLRIPGPTKYASHLQALLQQYLEIRATQYLKILEEADLQKEQGQHQQIEQHQEVQYQPEAPQSYAYQEQQQQHISYPAIDDVYQSYKGRHQESQQYEAPAQYTQEEPSQQHQEQPQQYYYMQVEQEQEQPAHAGDVSQGYQPIYYVAMPQADYQANYQDSYAPSVPQGYVDEGHLPIAENNPRHTHTKVLFTEAENNDHSTQYPLPSIKPFERHSPTPTPEYPPYQVDPRGEPADYQQQPQQYQLQGQASQSESVVSITQRPYNYHAHSPRGKNTKRNAAPSASASDSEENLKQLHTMINRLRTKPSQAHSRTKKETA